MFLSPYLFLVVMTATFYDVKVEMESSMEVGRVIGAEFDEVLYADDTILVSEEKAKNQQCMHKIEEVSEK